MSEMKVLTIAEFKKSSRYPNRAVLEETTLTGVMLIISCIAILLNVGTSIYLNIAIGGIVLIVLLITLINSSGDRRYNSYLWLVKACREQWNGFVVRRPLVEGEVSKLKEARESSYIIYMSSLDN